MTECDGGVKGARARGGDVNHAHSRTRTGGRVYREMSRLRGQTARRRERICQRRTFYHIHSSRRGSATTYDDQSSLMTRVITPTTSLVLGVSTFGFAGAGRSLRRARGDVRRVRGSRRVLCGRALRASRGGCRESWVSRIPPRTHPRRPTRRSRDALDAPSLGESRTISRRVGPHRPAFSRVLESVRAGHRRRAGSPRRRGTHPPPDLGVGCLLARQRCSVRVASPRADARGRHQGPVSRYRAPPRSHG